MAVIMKTLSPAVNIVANLSKVDALANLFRRKSEYGHLFSQVVYLELITDPIFTQAIDHHRRTLAYIFIPDFAEASRCVTR